MTPVGADVAAVPLDDDEVLNAAQRIFDHGYGVTALSVAYELEAVDADGQVLLQRTLQPGESVGLNGRLPLKLKIGNAVATQLTFHGQPVDLGPSTRDNVARLELK